MELDYELLEKIFNIASPTGYTSNIINFIKEYCENLGYATSTNKKGNLIISVKGNSPYTLGLSAHVDTLGLMVRSIMGNGNLKFTRVGGMILPTVDGEYCTIYTRDNRKYTGTVLSDSPSVHVYKDSQSKERTEDTMHIRLDEVVHSKDDTLKLGINNGDFIAIDPKFQVTPSGYIKTRFLDDKASVFILMMLLKQLKVEKIVPRYNLEIIITTYEEVGHGCANIPHLDEMIAVDMGCIGLDLACTEECVSICAKDSSGPYDYCMTTELINLAKANNINYAIDVYPFYSSDASAALRAGNDIRCALIGSGIHASHGMERTHINGINETLKLLILYIQAKK